MRKINEKQFEIELVKPSTEFLWILAMPYTAVVPRDVAQRYGSAFGTIECGSGPYQLKSWQRNYSMVFKRRPNRSDERDGFTLEETGFNPLNVPSSYPFNKPFSTASKASASI